MAAPPAPHAKRAPRFPGAGRQTAPTHIRFQTSAAPANHHKPTESAIQRLGKMCEYESRVRGEGRGEGAPQQNVSQRLAERPPHPDLLPARGEKERERRTHLTYLMHGALELAQRLIAAIGGGIERGLRGLLA